MSDEPTLDAVTPEAPAVETPPFLQVDPGVDSSPVEPEQGDGTRQVTQSFTVSCTVVLDANNMPAVDEEGNPIPPSFAFTPDGEGITMDDCIALACRGIQWILGARARVAAQQAAAMVEAKRQQDIKRILTPAEITAEQAMAPVLPPRGQRRIIRPQ